MVIEKNKKLLVLVESPNKTNKIKKILNDLGYNDITVIAIK